MKAGLMSSSGRIFARGYMGMSSMVLQGVYTFHVWRVVQGSQTNKSSQEFMSLWFLYLRGTRACRKILAFRTFEGAVRSVLL